MRLQEVYHHYAYKFLSNEGVQEMADVSVSFDPNHEKLIFHRLVIHRGDQEINKLPLSIKTIQHEENINRYLYDESHTAIVNLPDIRVGDILEYAYTVKGFNPVFEGRVMEEFYANMRIPFDKKVFRLVVPASTTLNIKNVNTSIQPVMSNKGSEVSYLWTKDRSKGLLYDSNVPDWHNPFERVVISSFNSWQEVSDWGVSLYRVNDSDKKALRILAEKILTETDDDLFAMQAIQFVQDEIRYLGFEGGLNGYKPHSPLQVWQQRFGDCKDKSLLLCNLLELKGIQAYPMLVNTIDRQKINEGLPSILAFNHCVVQFKVNDELYYVDPTISNQGGTLQTFSFPNYGLGLVLNGSPDLISLAAKGVGYQREIQTFRLDSIGGTAQMEVRTIFEGSAADSERSNLANARLGAMQKTYKEYYADQYPDIAIAGDLTFEDNRVENKLITTERYFIRNFWLKEDESKEKIYCWVKATTLQSYFNVSKSMSRNVPYALPYPIDRRHEIRIQTPVEWSITPENVVIDKEHYRYSYEVTFHDSLVVIATDYATKADAVPTDSMEEFISDHGKMMDNLSYYLTWDPTVVAVSPPLWPGLLFLTVIIAAGAFLALYRYRNYDPQPFYPPAWGQRIEGWLVLPALGVLIAPATLLISFVKDPALINGQGWVISAMNGEAGFFVLNALVQIYNGALIVFSGLMVVLFFRRRSCVPNLMIYYYGIPVIWLVLYPILSEIIAPEQSTFEPTSIFLVLVPAAIWIPYFKTSHRVKRTFVNRYNQGNDGESLAMEGVPVS